MTVKNKWKDRMGELYLYCLRENIEDTPAISAKGIDGREEVFIIPYQKLEAIVSNSSEGFASEEIQKKAQEDVNWIKEKALVHEMVIEEAMGKGNKSLSLIPMRFGTVFKDRMSLESALNRDYPMIREVLDRIKGKQEWSTKVYLKSKELLEQRIKETNEAIKQKEEEISSLPEGMAFFMEEELKEAVSKVVNKELDNIMRVLSESLKKHAVDSIKCKNLERELTGRKEPMVLNVAYLILEEKVGDFKKAAEGLNQNIQTKGFSLEYSGPWPAYNFTSY
jgi:hypothetical protein